MTALRAQAIQTALIGDWESAITCNKKLLKVDPSDIEALNRLAFAFLVIGKTKHAKEAYMRVLAFDKLNAIAIRGLKRLTGISKKRKNDVTLPASLPDGLVGNIFLEETGKTKVVELINVAQAKTIAVLRTGEQLFLSIKRLKVFVHNQSRQYVGMLPDSIGKRLIKLIRGGNSYEAYVKSANNHHVTVFVKETKRAARFRNQPSFTLADRSQLVVGAKTRAEAKRSASSAPDAEDDEAEVSYEEADESL